MVSSFARSSQAKAPCYGLEEMLGRWKHLHVPTLTIQRCQPPATKVPVMLSSMAWRSSVKLGQVRQIWFAPCLCTSPAVKLLATYSDSLCFRFPVCKTRVTEGPSPSGTDMILEILLREEWMRKRPGISEFLALQDSAHILCKYPLGGEGEPPVSWDWIRGLTKSVFYALATSSPQYFMCLLWNIRGVDKLSSFKKSWILARLGTQTIRGRDFTVSPKSSWWFMSLPCCNNTIKRSLNHPSGGYVFSYRLFNCPACF